MDRLRVGACSLAGAGSVFSTWLAFEALKEARLGQFVSFLSLSIFLALGPALVLGVHQPWTLFGSVALFCSGVVILVHTPAWWPMAFYVATFAVGLLVLRSREWGPRPMLRTSLTATIAMFGPAIASLHLGLLVTSSIGMVIAVVGSFRSTQPSRRLFGAGTLFLLGAAAVPIVGAAGCANDLLAALVLPSFAASFVVVAGMKPWSSDAPRRVPSLALLNLAGVLLLVALVSGALAGRVCV